MIYLTIDTSGLDTLGAFFHDLEVKLRDVMPLARAVADTLAVENMQARMMGVDRDGVPFAELADSTWKRHPNRGAGPPLDPMEMESRIVSGFVVEIDPVSPGNADVIGSWPSMDEFILYHITGTRRMPRRDPAGIPPSGWAAIADVFDRFMDNLAGVE